MVEGDIGGREDGGQCHLDCEHGLSKGAGAWSLALSPLCLVAFDKSSPIILKPPTKEEEVLSIILRILQEADVRGP